MNEHVEFRIEEVDYRLFTKSLSEYSHFLMVVGNRGGQRLAVFKWGVICLGVGLAGALFATIFQIVLGQLIGKTFGFDNFVGVFGLVMIGLYAFCLLSFWQTKKMHRSVFRYAAGTSVEFKINEDGWSYRGIGMAVTSAWGKMPVRILQLDDSLVFVSPLMHGFVPQRALDRPVSEIVQFMQACQEAAALDTA